jgi:hypothetical protein
LSQITRLALMLSLTISVSSAWAVGGPPLVTDDPDTPGDGHWEINLATITQRTLDGYSVAVPDADINYGLGDFIQLKADVPLTYAQQPGDHWKSGPGFANYGVKWRFVDEEESGFSVSTYPQYAHSLSSASINRGIAPGGGQFFLPIEMSGKVNGFDLDTEVGRNFVQGGPDQWEVGFVVGHDCAKDVECLIELHETYTESGAEPGSTQSLVNLGLNWKLTESLTLLAAAGKEFGKQTPYQLQSLLYLGIQITR